MKTPTSSLRTAAEILNPEPAPTPPPPPQTCRERLAAVADETRRLHSRVIGLREIVTELERGLVAEMQSSTAGGNEPGNVEGQKAALTLWLNTDAARRLVAASGTLSALESSTQFREADAALTPLLAEVAALNAAEAAHREAVSAKQHDLVNALAAAEAAAKLAALESPEVVAARRELEVATRGALTSTKP